MVMWRVREFHADDLDAAIRLWDDPAASSEAPLFGLSDLIAAVRSHQPAVAAVVGEELAGAAVATVTGDQAWVMRISLAAAWRRRFPSRLAGESPAGLAAALREAFALVAELDKVVLFIDEVEEIAGSRRPRTVSAAQGVTNEMLKLIPAFREQEERLLICATNSVRALDSAFLRHGRFDYVLPIGPPDPAARQAIWDRYLADIPHDELDLDAIVAESRLFTPADIEFAARRTAQLAFERVLFEHGKELVTTDDILHAISQTRRTLTSELVAEFEQDITGYARM